MSLVGNPEHAPVYAQGRCTCGWTPPMLLRTDSPEWWDRAVDEHIAAVGNHQPTQEDRVDKLAEANRLIAEVNAELPDGFNFEFAVVELPTVRTNSRGEKAWQAYEDQFVTTDGEAAFIDGQELAPLDIADGLGAALVAAARSHDAVGVTAHTERDQP